MEQLLTVARRHSAECRGSGGSRHVFSHPAVAEVVTVPAHRPIKAIYVKQFVALIDRIKD
jgi:hypothetical protein